MAVVSLTLHLEILGHKIFPKRVYRKALGLHTWCSGAHLNLGRMLLALLNVKVPLRLCLRLPWWIYQRIGSTLSWCQDFVNLLKSLLTSYTDEVWPVSGSTRKQVLRGHWPMLTRFQRMGNRIYVWRSFRFICFLSSRLLNIYRMLLLIILLLV